MQHIPNPRFSHTLIGKHGHLLVFKVDTLDEKDRNENDPLMGIEIKSFFIEESTQTQAGFEQNTSISMSLTELKNIKDLISQAIVKIESNSK